MYCENEQQEVYHTDHDNSSIKDRKSERDNKIPLYNNLTAMIVALMKIVSTTMVMSVITIKRSNINHSLIVLTSFHSLVSGKTKTPMAIFMMEPWQQ